MLEKQMQRASTLGIRFFRVNESSNPHYLRPRTGAFVILLIGILSIRLSSLLTSPGASSAPLWTT